MLTKFNPFHFFKIFLREERGAFAIEFAFLAIPVILLGALSTEQLLNHLQRNEIYNHLKEDSMRFAIWREDCPNAAAFRREMCEDFYFLSKKECEKNVRIKVKAMSEPNFSDNDLIKNPKWEDHIDRFSANDYLVMTYFIKKKSLFNGLLNENEDKVFTNIMITRTNSSSGCT